jgi:CRISPR system Cascade subunit CasA
MRQFNLIDEKWIPVRFPDGTRDELGIRDTLLRSREIASIEDASPLVVAALHRFLLAVLYRALEGPTDIGQAKKLFKEGLPEEKITAYLEKWRDRFWLFDEKYPFGQNPNVPKGAIEPWTKLTAEYNATSNKVLFDHTDTKKPGVREPSECARWLISTMSFSISGGRGYYPSPSPNAMMCIPLGPTLHDTLCFCLVPYPNREVMHSDSALWERVPQNLPLGVPKKMASGYADLYSWQSRMIKLERLPTGEVSHMGFVAGQGFENLSNIPDPMQPYKEDETRGKLPVQFRKDRGTWRDFDTLLPDNTGLAPQTIQNAIRVAGNKAGAIPYSVQILGLRYEPPNANVDFWRMEHFILPESLASDRSVRSEINQLLTDADNTQKALWSACSDFARNILGRGERPPDKKDIKKFIEQMPVSPIYWSMLESNFHELLREFSLERGSEDIRCQWLRSVRSALQAAWNQHRASVVTGDAWAIRALVKAEEPVRRKLYELNQEIQKLEPKEEAV